MRRSTAVAPVVTIVRAETTGRHHSFEPGVVTRTLRALYLLVTPSGWRKSIARRMHRNMQRVESMERDHIWLKRHGSPLFVMGLPPHAELAEVKARYRDLILETHPDTRRSTTVLRKGSCHIVVRPGQEIKEYEVLQTAYKMITNPTSLWHQNGSAPVLYDEVCAVSLVPPTGSLENQVTAFAIATWIVALLVASCAIVVGFTIFWEQALQLFDPEFYAFMLAQEKQEARQRALGIEPDTDPKRLAPRTMKRMLFPGRFVHGENEVKSV